MWNGIPQHGPLQGTHSPHFWGFGFRVYGGFRGFEHSYVLILPRRLRVLNGTSVRAGVLHDLGGSLN